MTLPWDHHRNVYMVEFDAGGDKTTVYSFIIVRRQFGGWCKVRMINIIRIDGQTVTETNYDLAIHNQGNSIGAGNYMSYEYSARLKDSRLTIYKCFDHPCVAHLEKDYEWDGSEMNLTYEVLMQDPDLRTMSELVNPCEACDEYSEEPMIYRHDCGCKGVCHNCIEKHDRECKGWLERDNDIKNKSLSWTCQNTACCNPEHMIVGPSRV